jgi:hypothetical protein
MVFASLYEGPCREALRMRGIPTSAIRAITIHLTTFYGRMASGHGTSRTVHLENMVQLRSLLMEVHTNRTCLACLRRVPQHPLSCRHALCDECFSRFGKPLAGTEFRYHIRSCILCQYPCNIQVNLLPRTASVRAMTIDGGGVRGVIPLQFLRQFEDLLGPECPLQDLVDVAFGTSAGTKSSQYV